MFRILSYLILIHIGLDSNSMQTQRVFHRQVATHHPSWPCLPIFMRYAPLGFRFDAF